MEPREEGSSLALDFGKLRSVADSGQRLVPVVLQHADSQEVLFVGYANQEALRETLGSCVGKELVGSLP